jgi:hypothetical protein
MQENTLSSKFVGLNERSSKHVFNFFPIWLGVSNRTAKKAKWLGGKLEKRLCQSFIGGSSEVLIGV